MVSEETAGKVDLPERLEKRLEELRQGVLQKDLLTQGETHILARELLAMVSPDVPKEENAGK